MFDSRLEAKLREESLVQRSMWLSKHIDYVEASGCCKSNRDGVGTLGTVAEVTKYLYQFLSYDLFTTLGLSNNAAILLPSILEKMRYLTKVQKRNDLYLINIAHAPASGFIRLLTQPLIKYRSTLRTMWV